MKKLKNFFYSQEEESTLYSFGNLIFLALVVYAQQAWVPGFFKDGYLYSGLARNAANGNWWLQHFDQIHFPDFAHHPPLAFMLQGLWTKIFGFGWTSLCLSAVSFGLMTVGLVYAIVRFMGNARFAYFATLMMILTPPFFKKARSPNLDVPLTFFILSSLSLAMLAMHGGKSGRKSFYLWLGCGLSFGLALLIKGPPALMLPITLAIYVLIFERQVLRQPGPYLGLILGFFIFSLWPLQLWRMHRLDIFFQYFNFQVLGTIVEGRQRQEFFFGTYPYYLLENNPLVFLLALLAIYWVLIRQRKEGLHFMVRLFITHMLCVLVLFSLVRWKYSNYIVQSFPSMAILAGWSLSFLPIITQRWIIGIIRKLSLAAGLILLIFPITVNIHRDVPIFRAVDYLRALNQDIFPRSWVIVGNSYPKYDLANLVGMQQLGWVESGSVDKFLLEYKSEVGRAKIFLFSFEELDQLFKKVNESELRCEYLLLTLQAQKSFALISSRLAGLKGN